MNPHLKIIVNCIKEASEKGSLIEKNEVLTGYSGESIYGTLQRLAKETLTPETCYLEVGVYQGLTLLSTAKAAPEHSFFGIDNFAFFDRDGKNEQIINDRMNKLSITNAHLINCDYEDALENLSKYIGNKKVGIYFIDGPHDYRSQFMCLMLIKPYLADNAVILVDDSNYRHVRQANRDFLLTNPEFKLLFQSYTKAHPLNVSANEKANSMKNWWDGINMIYKDTNNELAPFYPETFRDRTLYENEHILQASQYPDQILRLWDVAKRLHLFPLLNLIKKPKKAFIGKFKVSNTHSENLPSNSFNKSVL